MSYSGGNFGCKGRKWPGLLETGALHWSDCPCSVRECGPTQPTRTKLGGP
jgi:hypothetical protein